MKVLKFSATWCGPCKMLSRILEDVESPVEIINVDIDENQQEAVKYAVRGVPTCVLIDENGGEIRRKVGMMNEKEFMEFVSQ